MLIHVYVIIVIQDFLIINFTANVYCQIIVYIKMLTVYARLASKTMNFKVVFVFSYVLLFKAIAHLKMLNVNVLLAAPLIFFTIPNVYVLWLLIVNYTIVHVLV